MPGPTPVSEGATDADPKLWIGSYRAVALFALASLLVFWAASWAWWAFCARLFLARVTTTERLEIVPIAVRRRDDLFGRVKLHRLAQELRKALAGCIRGARHQGDGCREPARAGVVPGAVAARRHSVPEYLVLVDRASVRDHQARLIDGLVDPVGN